MRALTGFLQQISTLIPMIRFALFVFECILYNVQCLAVLQWASSVQAKHRQNCGICSDCALQSEGFLDDKGPPPDKIYEELIEKIGYFGGFSL
ncbi:hypothetical protein DRN80_03910 [Methanosarcinales archaeon]|nr:MAG: hypothetical protein DRN80_03910 [Methanosarcinales archaeon]